MEKLWFMPKPCKHCPYRNDVKPFLTADRGSELAYHTTNPYNSFSCHKTTVSDEEFGGEGGEMVTTEDSLECAGFLSMQISAGARCPDGFTPADNTYSDTWEMIEAYEIENE